MRLKEVKDLIFGVIKIEKEFKLGRENQRAFIWSFIAFVISLFMGSAFTFLPKGQDTNSVLQNISKGFSFKLGGAFPWALFLISIFGLLLCASLLKILEKKGYIDKDDI
jgi:hypothetical protein